MNSTFFEFINTKRHGFFMFCSPDFFVGGLGGAFLPHAEIKGASKIATKHIKTRPFFKIFFIPQSIFFLLKKFKSCSTFL